MKVDFFLMGDSIIEMRLDSSQIEIYLQLQDFISSQKLVGIREFIPTSTALAFTYDQDEFDLREFENILGNFRVDENAYRRRREILEIPVCYDTSLGIDLGELSETLNLEINEIIEFHCGSEYQVAMFGFVPGFVYLNGLPEPLRVKRKDSPNLAIPPGSVAIAGDQCGIYPAKVPGGWHVVGRTPLSMVDFDREDPFPLELGQLVKFRPIELKEFNAYND